MSDLHIERALVNFEALDDDLRAALGAAVAGISFARGVVTVHLTSAATVEDSETARRIVVQHDPAKLSPRQQQAQERQARLDAARRDKGDELDTGKFADALLAELARKVAWLELEILSRMEG